MTTDEFASTIKAKYSSYQSVDNATLVSAITKKYPQQYGNYSQMDINGQTPNPAGGQLFDWLFNKVPKNAIGNGPDQNPSPLNIGSILDSLTSGIQTFGKATGAAITENMPGVQKAQTGAQNSANQLSDINTKLIALSKQKKAAGQDTSSIDKVIAENEAQMNSGNIGYNANTPAGAKLTPGQILGSAGEMALDILSSGELQDVAKGAQSFKLIDNATKARLAAMGVTDSASATSLISKLKAIGKFSLQSGSIGYGFDVSKNLQGGATGVAAAQPGWGALIGTLLPAALGTYAGLRTVASPGKTFDEILATKPEDVMNGKLNAEDTKTWFESQTNKLSDTASLKQKALTDQFTQANTARQATIDAQKTASKVEQANLQKEMESAAIGETKATRPTILKTFANASKTFGDLAQEAVDNSGLSKASDIGIDNIKTAFANEFAEDPELMNAQLSRIGLSTGEDPLAAILGKQSGAEVQEMSPTNKLMRQLMGEEGGKETMTVGDVQKTIQDLRQSMSGAARKGSRTFTAAEMTTSRTIAALSDALDKAGIDMSEANKFWAEWKPVQQEALRTFDPFGAKGSSGLKSGATALMEKAQGNQFTQDFFSKLEGYAGKPIGQDTQAAFEKLSAADQKAVSESSELKNAMVQAKQEMDAASAQIDKEAKTAQGTIDQQKVQALRKVSERKIRNNAIRLVAGTAIFNIPIVKKFVTSLISEL